MDDGGILRLFLERNEDAPAELEKKYGAACFKLALRMLSDPRDAEECVNDALLGVWNAVPPAEPELIGAYFMRTVRNTALNRLDYRTADKRTAYTLCLEELRECVPSGEDVETALIRAEFAEKLSAFLDKLPKEERAIFLRRYWYFETAAEIAASLGLSAQSVRARLKRTRGKLKKQIDRLNERNGI